MKTTGTFSALLIGFLTASTAGLVVPQNLPTPRDNTSTIENLALHARANGFDCGDLRDYSYFIAVKTSENALRDAVKAAVSAVLKELPVGQYAATQGQHTEEKNGYLVQASWSNVASDAVRTDIIRDALTHLRDATINVGKGKRIPANSVAWYTANYITDAIGGVTTIRTLKRNPSAQTRSAGEGLEEALGTRDRQAVSRHLAMVHNQCNSYVESNKQLFF